MKAVSLRGTFYGIGAASIWGGMYVVSDEVLKFIPPFTLLNIRLVIGLAILAGILVAQRRLFIPWRDALKLLGVGVVGYAVSLGAQFVGTSLSTAINGAVITSASPAFILLFAWLLLREPLTPIRVGSVALASVGVLVVLDLNDLKLGSETLAGNLALALAALSWGAYSVLVRRVSASYSTLTISAYALVGGLILDVPFMLRELATTPVAPLNMNLILGILYLGVVSTAFAMWLWNRAFALVEASIASLFFFAQPLVGVLLSTWLLGQALTPELMFGGLLIVGGVALSMLEGRRTTDRASAPLAAETPESKLPQ